MGRDLGMKPTKAGRRAVCTCDSAAISGPAAILRTRWTPSLAWERSHARREDGLSNYGIGGDIREAQISSSGRGKGGKAGYCICEQGFVILSGEISLRYGGAETVSGLSSCWSKRSVAPGDGHFGERVFIRLRYAIPKSVRWADAIFLYVVLGQVGLCLNLLMCHFLHNSISINHTPYRQLFFCASCGY